jgi:hypothetical protein
MMEDATLQLIIRHFEELKADINGVKKDIEDKVSAVSAGQEELKNDI